jgi:hypothetical protein
MLEEGIDISAEKPKILTTEAVQASDVVITMGCGDTCPIFPGKRYEDWTLEDPAGQGVDSVRPIRDEIKERVLTLLKEFDIEPVLRAVCHGQGHHGRTRLDGAGTGRGLVHPGLATGPTVAVNGEGLARRCLHRVGRCCLADRGGRSTLPMSG